MLRKVLCISTSFRVLRAPECWSKHFFSAVFNLFWVRLCLPSKLFSGNKTFHQSFGAKLKKRFLQNFATNFLLFSPFSAFRHEKCLKWGFRPAFRECSTQTLVKIYNSPRCQDSKDQIRLSISQPSQTTTGPEEPLSPTLKLFLCLLGFFTLSLNLWSAVSELFLY